MSLGILATISIPITAYTYSLMSVSATVFEKEKGGLSSSGLGFIGPGLGVGFASTVGLSVATLGWVVAWRLKTFLTASLSTL